MFGARFGITITSMQQGHLCDLISWSLDFAPASTSTMRLSSIDPPSFEPPDRSFKGDQCGERGTDIAV
jgi:hypothetical protein